MNSQSFLGLGLPELILVSLLLGVIVVMVSLVAGLIISLFRSTPKPPNLVTNPPLAEDKSRGR